MKKKIKSVEKKFPSQFVRKSYKSKKNFNMAITFEPIVAAPHMISGPSPTRIPSRFQIEGGKDFSIWSKKKFFKCL